MMPHRAARGPIGGAGMQPLGAGYTSGMRLLRALLLVLAVVIVLSGLSGCAQEAERSAKAAVRSFDEALSARDAAAACALLSTTARSELESSRGRPCAATILDEVPAVTSAAEVEVYGDQAIERTGRRATFLVRYASGWRVTAAGCTEQRDRYDCTVQGG